MTEEHDGGVRNPGRSGADNEGAGAAEPDLTSREIFDAVVAAINRVRGGLAGEERGHFFNWLLSTPVNLAIVLLTVSVSFVVAMCSAGAAMVAPLIARADTENLKFEKVYADFIDAADKARDATDEAAPSCGTALLISSGTCRLDGVSAAIDKFTVAKATLKAYASADGARSADALAELLPTNAYRFADGLIHVVDPVRYSAAVKVVLTAMCQDIRATRDDTCGS